MLPPMLPEHYDLYTLVMYVDHTTGSPNHDRVTDLLDLVYFAQGAKGPSKEWISQEITRFKKRTFVLDVGLREAIAERTDSGELKEALLTDYPGSVIPN